VTLEIIAPLSGDKAISLSILAALSRSSILQMAQTLLHHVVAHDPLYQPTSTTQANQNNFRVS
jgi:hypothetical protein